MVFVIDRATWAENTTHWQGEIEGAAYGMPYSIIFFGKDAIGSGPRLHTHPYLETFIVRTGRALFTLGDKEIEATAGQVLVAPAGTPHKFKNLGPGLLETIDIHASDHFETTWLE